MTANRLEPSPSVEVRQRPPRLPRERSQRRTAASHRSPPFQRVTTYSPSHGTRANGIDHRTHDRDERGGITVISVPTIRNSCPKGSSAPTGQQFHQRSHRSACCWRRRVRTCRDSAEITIRAASPVRCAALGRSGPRFHDSSRGLARIRPVPPLRRSGEEGPLP